LTAPIGRTHLAAKFSRTEIWSETDAICDGTIGDSGVASDIFMRGVLWRKSRGPSKKNETEEQAIIDSHIDLYFMTTKLNFIKIKLI
jgi:hypothetical protein